MYETSIQHSRLKVDPFTRYAPPAEATIIEPGVDTLKAAIEAGAEGESFFLKAGIHRINSAPRTGVVFKNDMKIYGQIDPATGEPLAIISGGKVATGLEVFGNNVRSAADFLNSSTSRVGNCDAYPGNTYRQSATIDGVMMMRLETLPTTIPSGEWYLDIATGRAYFSAADNPIGKTVEVAWQEYFVWYDLSGAQQNAGQRVKFYGVTFEKFGCAALTGAIDYANEPNPRPQGPIPMADWVFDGCTFRLNHGMGCIAYQRWQFLRCKFIDNGHKALGGKGDYIRVDYCEVFENNRCLFNAGWDSGGIKISGSKMDVRGEGYGLWKFRATNTWLHGNLECLAGLWNDVNTANASYRYMTITDHEDEGQSFEVSDGCDIRCCRYFSNGLAPGSYGNNTGQVKCSSSGQWWVQFSEVERLGGTNSGIIVYNQNRGHGMTAVGADPSYSVMTNLQGDNVKTVFDIDPRTESFPFYQVERGATKIDPATYTIAGSTITFQTPLPGGAVWQCFGYQVVWYQGNYKTCFNAVKTTGTGAGKSIGIGYDPLANKADVTSFAQELFEKTCLMDYNQYFQPSSLSSINFKNTTYTLAGLQAAFSNQEPHGVIADPASWIPLDADYLWVRGQIQHKDSITKPPRYRRCPIKPNSGDTKISYVADGTQTAFNVPFLYASASAVKVSVGGNLLSSGYTLSGQTVTFDSPPAVGRPVVIQRRHTLGTFPHKTVEMKEGGNSWVSYVSSGNMKAYALENYDGEPITFSDPSEIKVSVNGSSISSFQVVDLKFTTPSTAVDNGWNVPELSNQPVAKAVLLDNPLPKGQEIQIYRQTPVLIPSP